MFPGFRLEMPFWPVMYRLVGTGTPLTDAADPPLGPLLPSEPAADDVRARERHDQRQAARRENE